MQLTIKTNGEIIIQDMLIVNNGIKANYLSGNNISLLQVDNDGNIIPFLFPNSAQKVLYGNGIWGYLPENNGWKVNGNDMFAIPTGNIGIGTETPQKKLDVNGTGIFRDSLGIGVLNPQAPLDVQGDVIVRGWLYAQNGVVVGKKFEGEKVETDTVETKKSISKISTTDTLTSQKINTKNIKIEGIIINGNTNKIYSTVGNISFENTNFDHVGTLRANTIEANNLNVSYTDFDSLRVYKEIKVGTNSLSIAGSNFTGTTDQILSNEGLITLGGSPDLNDITVGIGTENPQEKLHIEGQYAKARIGFGENYLKVGYNAFHAIIESHGTDAGHGTLLINWYSGNNVVVGGGGSDFSLPATGTFSTRYATYLATENGKVGIGTSNPQEKLEIIGNINLESPGPTTNADLKIRLHQKCAIASYNTYNSPNNTLYINRDWNSQDSYHSDFDIVSIYGNVGIGTTNPQNYKLAVNGAVIAEDFTVQLHNDWTNYPDFVFSNSYQMMDLLELEKFIKKNNHLPNIPTAKEVSESGLKLGEMDQKLLQKVEELTLYIIEQDKKIKAMEKEIQKLK